jgi:glutamate/tyrosine decarboxylase-like PLP-dependent enzyme
VKHKIDDEVRVRVTHDHEIHIDDVEQLVDKVVEGALVLIAATTVARIIKKHL